MWADCLGPSDHGSERYDKLAGSFDQQALDFFS
jgi:hypothetical protein